MHAKFQVRLPRAILSHHHHTLPAPPPTVFGLLRRRYEIGEGLVQVFTLAEELMFIPFASDRRQRWGRLHVVE